MTSTPRQGSVADTSVPKLMLDLYRDHYSGALSLQHGRTHKKILFLEGAPVAAESDLASETLCSQLQQQGAINKADATRVAQAIQQKGYDESGALLDLGLLEPRDLFDALKEQVRRRAISCFGWSQGDYEILPDEAPSENIQPFRADPLALVQEGLETAWDVDRMLLALAPRIERFPVATRALAMAVLHLRTDEATDAMLRQLDGSRSLADVLSGVVRSPRALAAAWVVDACGLLQYRKTAIAESSEDSEEPEVEIEIAGPAHPGVVSDPLPPTAKSSDSGPPSAASGVNADKAAVMRGEIVDRAEKLADLDFYALLEIERGASTGEIKKAYFKTAKRYHPDALARLGLAGLKQEAAAVFSRVAEAYEVLGHSQKRAEYDAVLDSDGPEIDTAALAQAETFFRKGEILVRMGDFRGALQFLENAVQVWPDECAYHSLLGWAFYKKTPPDPERAREHLDAALALASEDSVTHFRLGVVLRALGETEAAAQSMARAKSLDPAAEQES